MGVLVYFVNKYDMLDYVIQKWLRSPLNFADSDISIINIFIIFIILPILLLIFVRPNKKN